MNKKLRIRTHNLLSEDLFYNRNLKVRLATKKERDMPFIYLNNVCLASVQTASQTPVISHQPAPARPWADWLTLLAAAATSNTHLTSNQTITHYLSLSLVCPLPHPSCHRWLSLHSNNIECKIMTMVLVYTTGQNLYIVITYRLLKKRAHPKYW